MSKEGTEMNKNPQLDHSQTATPSESQEGMHKPVRIYLPEGDSPAVQDYAARLMPEHISQGYEVTIGDGSETPQDSIARLAGDEFDAVIIGAEHTTGEVMQAALKIIGAKEYTSQYGDKKGEKVKFASTFFRMERPEIPGSEPFLMADCATNKEPSGEELFWIAEQTVESARTLGIEPRVAFISYSTKDSGLGKDPAKNGSIYNLTYAYERFIEEHPEIPALGPAQWDAANDPEVYEHKTKEAYPLDGDPTIYIFPTLEASNDAYKILEDKKRGGGWTAEGPNIQGLDGDKIVVDMSRNVVAEKVSAIVSFTAGRLAVEEASAPEEAS